MRPNPILVLSFTAALSVNTMTLNMFLSVFFLPGVLDACRTALFVTMPRDMKALSGSCLLIPCNFTSSPTRLFDGKRKTFGIWRINNHEVFHSEGKVTNYPMNFTGNLREKNCTTLFSNLIPRYAGTYLFRVLNPPFRATATCDPLQIIVKDSPPRPTLEVSGDLSELKEKESVTITCSAPTPCPHSPPRLTWSLQQDAHSQTEENTDRTFTTKIQQTVTLSDQHDGFILSCSAEYPVDGGERVKTAVAELTLSVSYAPKDTSASISPSGLVSAGSWVDLTCSSRARPAVSYTWFKISDRGVINVFEGDFYSFNVTEGGVYYCVAVNNLGNQTSGQLRLTVPTTGSSERSLGCKALPGVNTVLISLICLFICVWTFMHWRRTKKIDSTIVLSESTSGEEPAGEEPAGGAEDEGEDIHYSEIDFSNHKPDPSFKSESSRKREDTLYAEVNLSQRPNSSTHTADDPEDLYSLDAEVKKNGGYSV